MTATAAKQALIDHTATDNHMAELSRSRQAGWSAEIDTGDSFNRNTHFALRLANTTYLLISTQK